MEAMWINFASRKGKKFAIRPFIGGVNGISGESTIGNLGLVLQRMNSLGPRQDYLVLPEQDWLDGIAVSPGVVRQFVATEMVSTRRDPATSREPGSSKRQRGPPHSRFGVGSSRANDTEPLGASIEWQVTGRDEVGGIQLQIIPTYDVGNIYAGTHEHVCPDPATKALKSCFGNAPKDALAFDAMKTPEELGLRIGSIFHIKDMRSKEPDRAKTIADLLREAPDNSVGGDTVDLGVPCARRIRWVFRVAALSIPENSGSVFEVGIRLSIPPGPD